MYVAEPFYYWYTIDKYFFHIEINVGHYLYKNCLIAHSAEEADTTFLPEECSKMASIFAAVGLIVNLIIQIHVMHYSSPSNED